MMNRSSEELTRLHPISILYFLVVAIKETFSHLWLFPIIVIVVNKIFGDGISIILIGVVVVILTIITILMIGVIRWYLFGYVIEEDSIFLQTGIMNKKQRWISADRIHSINTSIRLYDRIFSTHTLLIELASAEDSSIVFSCLSDVEEQKILHVLRRNKNEDMAELVDTTMQLSRKDILLHASLSPRLGVVFGIILVIFFKYLDFTEGEGIETIHEFIFDSFGLTLLLFIIGSVFLLSVIVSFIFIYEKNYHFTINKTHEELEITHGLIVKKQRQIAIKRLQSIILIERPLQKLFGYVTVQAVIIQRGKEEDSEKTMILLPSIKKQQVNAFLKTFVAYEKAENLQTLTKDANFYYKYFQLIVGTVIAIPVWLFMPFHLHYIAPLIPVVLTIFGWVEYRNTGWLQTDEFLTLQYGDLTRKTAIIKSGRVQWAALEQSIFQKQKNLANIEIAVASGQNDIMFNVKQLPIKDAEILIYNKNRN